MKYLNYILFCLLFLGFVFLMKPRTILKEFHFEGNAQGTTYHISYFAAESIVGYKQFDSIFYKIDSSLSIYKPYSLISRFNNTNGDVEMDRHLKIIVQRSLEIYKKTGGISDITVYPIVEAWGFGAERKSALPDPATIKNLLPCVGSDKIFMDNNRLRKTNPCVKIDVNGIAQGYTVDVIADFLEKNRIQNYVVELGGELRVKGHKQPGNVLFRLGIESPAKNSFDKFSIKKMIQLKEGAVTTSGNYREFIEKGGKKISHLMNPKTGYPLQNEMISVTIWARDAITADGYDNALMGMGLKNSFAFLSKQKEMEAYFIYHTANGAVADTATVGFYKVME